MIEYLIPILRAHFTMFYRFGYTYIAKSVFIQLKNGITEDIKSEVIKMFESLSPFEYDEEYLILKISSNREFDTDNVMIEIQDVAAIFPLSHQAKQSIENKIDPRIRLEEPIFESSLIEIENFIERKEIYKGIDALWQIGEIKEAFSEVESMIGMDNILEGLNYRKRGKKASKIEKTNYWSLLIAYDRHDYFPNATIGYFYDSGQLFGYSKGLPTFEGSGLHKFLKNLSQDLKFNEIISSLESHEGSKNYREQTTQGELKSYIVAPLFFRWKEELRKSEDDIFKTTIFNKKTNELSFIHQYPNEVKAALFLLGAFFGFKKFYDNFYDHLNLRFYKTFKPQVESLQSDVEPANEPTLIVDEIPKEITLKEESTLKILVPNAEGHSSEIVEETLKGDDFIISINEPTAKVNDESQNETTTKGGKDLDLIVPYSTEATSEIVEEVLKGEDCIEPANEPSAIIDEIQKEITTDEDNALDVSFPHTEEQNIEKIEEPVHLINSIGADLKNEPSNLPQLKLNL